LNALGGFDERDYKRVADGLLTLWHNQRALLAGTGERLDVAALLGRGTTPGRTRLSIISTRFLPDQATVQFWVAQLLIAVSRWMGKHATSHLQGMFLFDEADLYLPAMSQPATKAPMEDLLKRARSAGVGLFLATQSPGDFDYKCRDMVDTWVVGRLRERNAFDKLKAMFASCKGDVTGKLANQGTGEFHLARAGQASSIHTHPSLITTEQLPEEKILQLARGSTPALAAQAAP
jgi:hypothetical protein